MSYCSKRCQAKHWPKHEPTCGKASPDRGETRSQPSRVSASSALASGAGRQAKKRRRTELEEDSTTTREPRKKPQMSFFFPSLRNSDQAHQPTAKAEHGIMCHSNQEPALSTNAQLDTQNQQTENVAQLAKLKQTQLNYVVISDDDEGNKEKEKGREEEKKKEGKEEAEEGNQEEEKEDQEEETVRLEKNNKYQDELDGSLKQRAQRSIEMSAGASQSVSTVLSNLPENWPKCITYITESIEGFSFRHHGPKNEEAQSQGSSQLGKQAISPNGNIREKKRDGNDAKKNLGIEPMRRDLKIIPLSPSHPAYKRDIAHGHNGGFSFGLVARRRLHKNQLLGEYVGVLLSSKGNLFLSFSLVAVEPHQRSPSPTRTQMGRVFIDLS